MIDLERARELLKQAMETQGPDFIYTEAGSDMSCHYEPQMNLNPEDPRAITGCLVGVALTLAGETRHLGYSGGVYELRGVFPDMMTYAAERYFTRAQSRQDCGETWGNALHDAENLIPYLRTP